MKLFNNNLINLTTLDLVLKVSKPSVKYWSEEAIKELLLDKSSNLEVEDQNGDTPLQYAVSQGLLELTELLLNRGVNIEAQEKDQGLTPLHRAIDQNLLEIVELLLKHQASVDALNQNDDTPLHFAIKNSNLEIVELLLKHQASVDSPNLSKNTPLHFAVTAGKFEIVELLLKYQASVTSLNQNDNTPLHIATIAGKLEIVDLLLNHQANVDSRNRAGDTPLHLAIKGSELAIVELLLKHQASVDTLNQNGDTPLHLAVMFHEVEIVDLLLKYRANVDLPNRAIDTPLHLAIKAGHPKIVELLLKHQASIDFPDRTGDTPLHLAIKYEDPETTLKICELLLKHQASAHSLKLDQNTPQTDLELVKLLLKHQVDINSLDENQNTPLHIATICGKIEIAELLLEQDASVDSPNLAGFTPLHYAAFKGKLDTTQLLLDHGANANALTLDGYTPAMIAQQNFHLEIQEVLEAKSGEFGKIWFTQKLLAARFGINLEVFTDSGLINLEGINSIHTYPRICQSFEKYLLSKQEDAIWKEKDFKDVLSTLQTALELTQTKDPSKVGDHIDQDKIVAIPTEWEDHAVGAVIKGNLLFKCNRGARNNTLPPGILVYKINKRKNLKKAIEQLVLHPSQDHFEKELDQKLALQHIDTIHCHEQSVGNCAWASAKLVLRATLFAQLIKKGVPPRIAKTEARKLYKEWSAQDRLAALKEYKQLVKEKDVPGRREMFYAISQKYSKKPAVKNKFVVHDLCITGMGEV